MPSLALAKSRVLANVAGLTTTFFDYYVDSVNGSDSNDGLTAETAWASLGKMSSVVVAELRPDLHLRVYVATGTYDTVDDAITVAKDGVLNAKLDIVFQTGCVMDGTARDDDKSAITVLGNQGFETHIFGNGLIIRNFSEETSGSPNGVGCSGYARVHCYNVDCINCDDGFSAHQNSRLFAHNCSAQGCEKGPWVHVDNAYVEAHDCEFTGGGSVGIGGAHNDTVSQRFYRTRFLPGPAESSTTLRLGANDIAEHCQFGTLTKSIEIANSAADATIRKSFINLYSDGNKNVNIDRCYGKLSLRQRNGGAISVEHSVIVAPASIKMAVLFSEYNPGAGSPISFRNNIIQTSSFMSLDATNAAYLIAAGSEFFNNLLYGGAVYDDDLVAADTEGTQILATVTEDPLIGSSNSYDMIDYAFVEGSPAAGAGTDGTDIGFSAAEALAK